METNLFRWEHMNVLNNLVVLFKACTLTSNIFVQGQAIGYNVGDKIEEIEVDYLGGTIKFFDHNDGSRVMLSEFIAELKIWGKR